MGKSRALFALLKMKHGRAPKIGLWFGGYKTSHRSGDQYYTNLVKSVISNGCEIAEHVDPTTLATMILRLVPISLHDMNSVPSGIEDVPGVRAYLDSDTSRRAGGIPVFVFDDVNIEDLSEDFRKSDMGRAHDFFDALMTQAFSSGKIVFVVTETENVARYFESLNEGTKSKVIIRSEESAGLRRFPFCSDNWMGQYNSA